MGKQYPSRRPEFLQTRNHGVLLDLLDAIFGQFLDFFRIMKLQFLGTPYGYSLEILGAHNCTHPVATGKMLPFIGNTGKTYQILSSLPDQNDPNLIVSQFIPDHLPGFSSGFAPKMRTVHKTVLTIIDVKINRCRRPASDHQGIKTGHFQFRPPVPSCLTISHSSSKGRFSSHIKSGSPANRSTDDWGSGKDQNVFRIKGINTRLH